MATASGIRKFTGFIAADGTTHDTMKKAVQHANDQKVKEALNAFNIKADEEGNVIIRMEEMGEYLFNNRVAIQAAFNAKATVRKTRTPKAKKVVATATTASANDDQAQAAA